jgi:hypothetical protein
MDEGPPRRRDLYLTTYNTHNSQTSMSPLGFEPTTLVSERPQTHALDRTATGIGAVYELMWKNLVEPDRPQMTYNRAHVLYMLDN